MLKKLLAEVVAEWIGHELDDVRASLDKDSLDVFLIAIFEFALQITTAMLIFAELVDTSTVGFEGDIVEASLVTMITAASASSLRCTIVSIVDAIHSLSLAIWLNRSSSWLRIQLIDIEGLHVEHVRLSSIRCGGASKGHHVGV